VFPFEDILAALNQHGVRYVIVGGLAVILHGHVRVTADIDLVIDLEPAQARAAIDALVGTGLRPLVPVDPTAFADKGTRESWVRDKNMQVFSLHDPMDPARHADLFVRHPIPFEELWAASATVRYGSTEVRVASLGHLKRMKRAAGRTQDLADIEALEIIHGEDDD
jgi:hypothetical protein